MVLEGIESLESLETKLKAAKEEIQRLKQEVSALDADRALANSDRENIARERDELEENLKDEVEKLSSLREAFTDFVQDLSECLLDSTKLPDLIDDALNGVNGALVDDLKGTIRESVSEDLECEIAVLRDKLGLTSTEWDLNKHKFL